MTSKDAATFQALFIVSLICAWNMTTVEINSGAHLLNVPYSIVTIGLSHTVSEINGAKIANFSYPVYITAAEWVTLGIGYRHRVRKKTTRMMGLLDGRKSFKIGLTV